MTRLEISDRRIHATVHHVWGHLPAAALERLSKAQLELISDGPCPELGGALGICLHWPNRKRIYLAPSLGRESWEKIALVVAHELGHACQLALSGDSEADELFAQAHARKWGFDPADRYPKVDWRR
jgi:hypothetical protein